MINFGLKLWSTNNFYIREAVRLWENNLFQYIELFTVPFSFDENHLYWKDLKEKYNIPFVIHAPHYTQGLNLADKAEQESNRKMLRDSLKFADELDANIVIIHPGVNGSEDETIRQINEYDDARLVVENKPRFGLNDELCNGYSPELIDKILSETGCGFCLDFGHAICAANAMKTEPFKLIKLFLAFNPVIFHLTDGDFYGINDKHLNYGMGNYPLRDLIKLIPEQSMVTNEAIKASQDKLDDFIDDYNFLMNKIKSSDIDIKKIIIKKASGKDIDDVYNLSNDSLIRQNSFNTDSIDYSNHVNWFDDKINNKNCLFLIARYYDKFLGQVRFDIEDTEAVISISVDGDSRGKGIGLHLVKEAVRILGDCFRSVKKVKALVKDSNEASKKFFVKANFTISGDTIVNQSKAKVYYLTVQ